MRPMFRFFITRRLRAEEKRVEGGDASGKVIMMDEDKVGGRHPAFVNHGATACSNAIFAAGLVHPRLLLVIPIFTRKNNGLFPNQWHSSLSKCNEAFEAHPKLVVGNGDPGRRLEFCARR